MLFVCPAIPAVPRCVPFHVDSYKMFSKDTPFAHVLAGVPAALRMALKERSLDQPGVLVAFIQDVLEEGTATDSIVDTGITTIDPIVAISSSSSSSLSLAVPSASPPPLPSVSHVSPSLEKPVVKTIRSRKGGKVRGVKKESMEGFVEERGGLEKEVEDVGGGKGRVADSVVLSTGGRVAECFPEVPGSPANLDVQNTIRTPADSAENPHFHGFSKNLKSCGVPARLKTSELSAHQMPKILHAERSSNASSASGLGGSTLDPWEQASRKSYRSLLDGGLLPSGHEDTFVKLAQKARPAEKRIKKRISAMSPLEFSQESREAEKARLQAEEVKKTATEQLIHASGRVPKKARTRLAMMAFSGPTARQDAERAEKSRWLGHLATLLTGTDTPLGRRLVEKPAACNSMGLGLRSGTLRNRVHALRRYFTWLASSHQVPFPCVEEHVLDYLELKVQEPCTRVSLKVVHQSLVYLEEISEISPDARLTVRPRYSNLLAELLSQTKPGAEQRQAPRPLLRVLEAIERTVVDYREPVFIRLYAWFYLLQTWCSLRFDDHRGLDSCATLKPLSQVCSQGQRHMGQTRGFSGNLFSLTRVVGLRSRTGVTSGSIFCKSWPRTNETTCCLLQDTTTQASGRQR